jgi:hypothetical protein
MPTTTKTKKGSPSASGQSGRRSPRPGGSSKPAGQSPRRFPRPGGSSQQTQGRSRVPWAGAKPPAKGPSELVERARGSLPGRKGKDERNAGVKGLTGRKGKDKKNAGVKGLLPTLGAGKSSARSRKTSKKSMLGLVATAGLGAAAIAKRRRAGSEDGTPIAPVQPGEASGTPPVQPGEASGTPTVQPVEVSETEDTPAA